jgi:hypothetical protein
MQLNTDRVVALSAMLIGLGSLFIIVYQTALLREQQAASALPYVMVGIMANDEQTYIVARNTGVGPALIEDVVVRYQGSEIQKDPHDFFRDVRPDAAALGLGVDRLIPGRLVSAGEAVLMLGTEGEGARPMVGEFLSLFDLGDAPQSWYDGAGVPKSGPDKAIIEIRYRSVYGDRWRVASDSVVPQPL